MPGRKGLRALVVEDEPAWQQIVSEILLECGLEVDLARDANAAVVLLRQASHRLAVVDLALGEGMAANKDGLGVLEAVRRQDPGCVTILLTGFATVELAVRVMTEYGAVSCVQKGNFDRGQFRALVNQALATAPMTREIQESPLSRTLLTKGVVPREEGPAVSGPALRGTPLRGRILVVDDDAGWRQILSELLSDAGYQARACSSYGEAVGYLRRESYSLAVVDLALSHAVWSEGGAPEPTGYDVLEIANDLAMAAIVVSGAASSGDIGRAYEQYGVFSYIEKQAFDRRAFLQTVAEACAACEGEAGLSALTARELEVLALLAQGKTNKAIAETLVISGNTVKRHLKAIFDKLDVHTRAAAAAKAIGAGLSAGPPAP